MNILFLVCVVDLFLKIQTVTCEINQLSFLHYHPTRKETYCSRRQEQGTSLKYSEICLHVPNTNTFCLVRGITRNLEVRLRTIWIVLSQGIIHFGWAKARRQAPPLPHGSYATGCTCCPTIVELVSFILIS